MKRESLKEREQAQCLQRAVEYVVELMAELGISENQLRRGLGIKKETLERLKKIAVKHPNACCNVSNGSS